jgi:hypothetical protein
VTEQGELQGQHRGRMISIQKTLKTKRVRRSIQHLAVLCSSGGQISRLEPTSEIMCGVLDASTSSPSKPGNTLKTVSGAGPNVQQRQPYRHDNPNEPAMWRDPAQGRKSEKKSKLPTSLFYAFPFYFSEYTFWPKVP